MLTIALRGLRANAARYTATIVAIVAGVGFLAAGLIVTDSIRTSLGGDAAEQYPAVAAAVQPDTSEESLDPTIDPALLATIEAVPLVDAAAGVLDGPLSVFDPETGRPLEEGATGSMWVTVAELNPLSVVEGRAPAATGEIALDRRSADRLDDATIGATLDIATVRGLQRATVVGLTEFGSRASENPDGTISVAEPWAFDVLGDGMPGYSEVLVAGPVDGPGQEELVAALGTVVPPGFVVLDRSEFLSQTEGVAASIADAARPVLIGFSLLALFVCGFVIYNTFSVVVAQRTRELALLRAVAATPRQVKRSVRVEGIVIGLAGSIIGVLVGVALTLAMPWLLGVFGLSVGSVGITVTATTVVSCILAGTIITLVSVLAPARRAARTPPVEALRSGPATTARTTALRTVISLLLIGGGAGLLVAGGTAGQPVLLGAGAFAFVLGVLVGGPVLAALFARAARWLTQWTGLTGRLASDNLVRNPRRTATTANALVIGVLLVTFVSIAGASVRDWSVEQINELSDSDLTISSNVGGIDPTLVTAIQAEEGVTATATVATSPATVNGSASSVSTGDPADVVSVAGVDVAQGSLDDLAAGGIALGAFSAAPDGGPPPEVGSTVTVVVPGGASQELIVVATLEFSITSLTLSNLMGAASFAELFGDLPTTTIYLDVEPGALDQVDASIEELVEGYSNVTVTRGNVIGEIVGSVFDFAINAVIALLGMSVVIAVIGIVNTLSLSIFEQRREIGMLRAVGMLPRDVRRMVRMESVLISMVGTLTGLVTGIFLAYFLTRPIGVEFNWQLPRLGLIVVLGVLVGFVASWAPARRVSRIDLLDALQA